MKGHAEQSIIRNDDMCVTTTGSLQPKGHGDNTGSDSEMSQSGAAPLPQGEDIVWTARICEGAEVGRNTRLGSWLEWLEKQAELLETTLSELYWRDAESSDLTGSERLVKLFRCSKRDVKRIRLELYRSGFALDREDTRRAKIATTTSQNRAAEPPSKAEGRLSKIKQTKAQWTQDMWDSVYGAQAERNKLVSVGRKEFFMKNPEALAEQVARFINAPKHTRNKPNRVEQNVLRLSTGLQFVGNGQYFVTLTLPDGSLWRKNPDFILKREFDRRARWVVEVMDFEYWHSKEEAKLVEKLYNQVGISCLVIDAKRCYTEKDLESVRKEILSFLTA